MRDDGWKRQSELAPMKKEVSADIMYALRRLITLALARLHRLTTVCNTDLVSRLDESKSTTVCLEMNKQY